MIHAGNYQSRWNTIYKIGGLAAIGAVLVGVAEIAITFLPGGNAPHETVLDWFTLFQENPFMGMRNLGLLNIFLNALGILTYFALYAAHRENPYQPYAALVTIISFLGIGVFFATNRTFPMLALSQQYAAATSDAQRAMLEDCRTVHAFGGTESYARYVFGIFSSRTGWGVDFSCDAAQPGFQQSRRVCGDHWFCNAAGL